MKVSRENKSAIHDTSSALKGDIAREIFIYCITGTKCNKGRKTWAKRCALNFVPFFELITYTVLALCKLFIAKKSFIENRKIN